MELRYSVRACRTIHPKLLWLKTAFIHALFVETEADIHCQGPVFNFLWTASLRNCLVAFQYSRGITFSRNRRFSGKQPIISLYARNKQKGKVKLFACSRHCLGVSLEGRSLIRSRKQMSGLLKNVFLAISRYQYARPGNTWKLGRAFRRMVWSRGLPQNEF